ncbi:MAG: hypothetical protein P8Y12_03680 [Gammaproteobacteria bacterium]|jgi:uncharacterized protein YjiS (DUF1127 family)
MNALFDRERINPTQLVFDTAYSGRAGKKSILVRWFNLAEYWRQKHKNYFQHLPLEDHLLQDIGKSRMDVELHAEELKCKLEARSKRRVKRD